MNPNKSQPSIPFPVTIPRFGRPWLGGRTVNPLHQTLPGSSQLSTGGSQTSAPHVRIALGPPAPRPPASQPDAADAQNYMVFDHFHGLGHRSPPFFGSQTQPSQQEIEFPLAQSGPSGGCPATQTQMPPSATAARLLQEFNSKQLGKEDTSGLLQTILIKLESLEARSEDLKIGLKSIEDQANEEKNSACDLEQRLGQLGDAVRSLSATVLQMVQKIEHTSSYGVGTRGFGLPKTEVFRTHNAQCSTSEDSENRLAARAGLKERYGRKRRLASEGSKTEDDDLDLVYAALTRNQHSDSVSYKQGSLSRIIVADDNDVGLPSRLARRVQRHRELILNPQRGASMQTGPGRGAM